MLKHMTPGPSSGQPRPPTRGLPHPHTQQQQQSSQTTTNGRPQPPQPPQSGSSTTTQQQQQQQQTIIQPLNVSNLSTPTTALTIPPKLIANGGLRHSALLNSTPITLTNNNNSNNNNNCNIKQNNNNSNNCNNNNNQQYNHNLTNLTNGTCNYTTNSTILNTKTRIGAREALTSLGLLCLVSLLLALLSLIFLLKISPGGRELPPPPPGPTSPEDYIIVYDVTLALCALSLSLNLCCLLVCAIQFLFAVKLVRAPATTGRGNKYLEKSSVSRVCAVGGFFISIPIFLTGIILYTFTQFHSTPAIITSVLIGIGIVFCGGAMVHNVFVWQKEKTICVRNQPIQMQISPQISAIAPPIQFSNQNQLNTNDLNQTTTTLNNNNNNNTSNNMMINPQSIGLSQIHLNLQHHQQGINNHQANHTPLTHTSQHSHATSLTPISPNHSHNNISFNHSYVPGYVVRAATATPPTPKINSINGGRCDGTIDGTGRSGRGGGGGANNNNSRGIIPPPPTLNDGQTTRDASGSISPGMPTNLEISNVTSTSPHELSTLV